MASIDYVEQTQTTLLSPRQLSLPASTDRHTKKSEPRSLISKGHLSLERRTSAEPHTDLQDLIVAKHFLRGRLVPFAVRNLAVGDRNVEGVVNQVVLKDSIVGSAGGKRWGRVNLQEEKHTSFTVVLSPVECEA